MMFLAFDIPVLAGLGELRNLLHGSLVAGLGQHITAVEVKSSKGC